MGVRKQIACVTGATGMVGRRIVEILQDRKYVVRALSRQQHISQNGVEHFRGGLDDKAVLEAFVTGADALFHCAAELNDESKMAFVNVAGTENLLERVQRTTIKFFLYLSSAGVIGRTSAKVVDEKTPCDPVIPYEKTKWAAEKIVARSIEGVTTVILRPTNVIDDLKPGALLLPMRAQLKDRLKVFLTGGEGAHLIHAKDVAAAAVYFVEHQFSPPRCFFVSCDHEQLNTVAGLWSLYKAIINQKPTGSIRPIKHLPIFLPYMLRRTVKGHSNTGDVRYSSEKLRAEGFKLKVGLEGAVKRVINANK